MARTKSPIPDIGDLPRMTRWFNPVLLTKLGWRVVVSKLFGQFADQRIIQALLDTATPEDLVKRHDFSEIIEPDKTGAVWIDYTADVGDGFDSTYAVAYLLAQDELSVGGEDLPQGSLLILGGDQVYPTATREDYRERMRTPYMLANPDSTARGSYHPQIFAIPGNHDWYDGLDSFFGTFCRFLDCPPYHGGLSIGNWRSKQMRSYFAIKLPHDWWIMGIDMQLTEYIDAPQIHYFRLIAESLADNAKVILCAAQPGWLKEKDLGPQKAFNNLKYVMNEILKSKASKVCAWIAGDIHNYNRYVIDNGSGLHLVTAGGGGAFLHPTHTLKKTIEIEWKNGKSTCSLATNPSPDGSETKACYPPQEKSKRLLLGNWRFIWLNWKFAGILGGVYALFSWMLLLCNEGKFFQRFVEDSHAESGRLGTFAVACFNNPLLPIGILAVIGALILYADARGWKGALIGTVHGIVHILAIFGVLAGLVWLAKMLPVDPRYSPILILPAMVIAGGVAGGLIWSAYLIFACAGLNRHTNDAFSAMRIEGYKNFLRLKLTPDELTIYPIGIEKVPGRKEWRENPQPRSDQGLSQFLPPDWFEPHLIEGPVRIRARKEEEKK